MQRAPAGQSYGLSLWFGTALIAVGVIVNVFAGWHHVRLVRGLDRGGTAHSRFPSRLSRCFPSSIGRAGHDNLIAATRTQSGLKVQAVLDTNEYETGVTISDEEMQQLWIRRHKTHPEWNYTISPRVH